MGCSLNPRKNDIFFTFLYPSLANQSPPSCGEGFLYKQASLAGGFKHFLFSSLFGEDSHFD